MFLWKKEGGWYALALHMKNYLRLKKLYISQLFPSFLEKESHSLIWRQRISPWKPKGEKKKLKKKIFNRRHKLKIKITIKKEITKCSRTYAHILIL